ncbi:hypothetical protein NM208_g7047 [Fusarium decemcellulare]|uniref:Uncharacterized protein n=1 Tax=Fusarium decemcellulare TaxID=57161 RepID=A0ACC1SAK9_9HYPO|nr:hypothetical protein NM208_g7047 [Fusarium decemcellulare]
MDSPLFAGLLITPGLGIQISAAQNPHQNSVNGPSESSFHPATINRQLGAMDQGIDGPQGPSAPGTGFLGAEVEQATTANTRKRSKYNHLNWNAQKAELKRLYMDQDKSLPETMQIMKDEHSFEASTKLYKEKFKQWGWNKKLPVPIAEFMANKAQSRKRGDGRDTVFMYGGKVWDRSRAENTLSRSKKSRTQDSVSDMTTPDGVSYKTPKALDSVEDASQTNEDTSEDSESGSGAREDVIMDDELTLPLSWNGFTRTQLLSMRREGSNLAQQGRLEAAREILTRVLEGFNYLHGAFHEESKKVAYELASLHTLMGDERDADHVLEKLTQAHIKRLGLNHKKTRQHVIHVVELLNGWNRHEDALGLLSLSNEMRQCLDAKGEPDRRRSRKRGRRSRRRMAKVRSPAREETDAMDIDGAESEISADASPSNINYRLDMAHSRVAAKDAGAETLLLALILHCENSPNGLTVQNLRARGELLDLYQKLDLVAARWGAFVSTLSALDRIRESYSWDEERYESIDVMEAYMQVVANILKSGFPDIAKAQFCKVSLVAEVLFTHSDERAVWINITIGLAIQRYMGWDDAEEWFNRAYSGAIGWGPKDGIVKSLENARKNHHFSYISDEGRPFKTICGISGIVIRPGRLHLE